MDTEKGIINDNVKLLQSLFERNSNMENSYHMEKYMRNQFKFLGIKTPKRKELMRSFFRETAILKRPLQSDFILALWYLDVREYQYAALDYIERSLKKLETKHLSLIAELITTKSWWDTVDPLATKSVGKIANDNPDVIRDVIDNWAQSNNMWLNRTAILFQLKYKEKTDEDLLYRYINYHSNSKEFFVQKAIGWALREYSKTNPESVKHFIESNTLAKLSVREGSKYI